MIKYFRGIKLWISILCAVSLMSSSLAHAAMPTIYLQSSEYMQVQFNEDYLWSCVSGYYPERNAPHYQVAIPTSFYFANGDKKYSVREIGEEVFANQTVSQIYSWTVGELTIRKKAFENVVVKNVPGSAVTDHSIVFEGDFVAGIGQDAFSGVKVSSDFIIENINGNVGAGAFKDAMVWGTVSIGGNIGTLGSGAFAGVNAGEWNISAEIRRIEDGAFQSANIKEYEIGETTTYLGSRLFEGSDLTRLCLPDTDFQGKVADDAFPDKEELTIVIPGGARDLSAYHFENYHNVTFEVPPDMPQDSAVMEFLQENDLKWRVADGKGPENSPTATPTADPTATPTVAPTATPTIAPTAEPTADPTATPTAAPTAKPTADPTATPTAAPTAEPTADPTVTPTADPTVTPTADPTVTPTIAPTATPTKAPITTPTAAPTGDIGNGLPDVVGDEGNTNKEKKDFTIRKIKYRVTAGNQLCVLGASDRKLSILMIPDTVTYQGRLYKITSVNKKAFARFSRLKKVYIGNFVKNVGDQAFSGCKRLSNISFGRRVTVLGSKVLYQDEGMKRIIFRGKTLKKMGKKTFRGVPKSVRITVPKTTEKKYIKLIGKAK